MSMSMSMQLVLKPELTLQQKLKMELTNQLLLTQKMELKLYLKLQDYFEWLYEEAERREYDRHGIWFDYALIGKKDLPSNFPLDAGFCIIKYDPLTGEVTDVYRFVVRNFCKPFPKRYRDLVALHEYGESLLIGHQESSVLEWGMAKKERVLGPYLDWMEERAPAKLYDLAHYSMLWDMMPDEVTAAMEKRRHDNAEKQALLSVMKGLEMPEEVRSMCRKFEGLRDIASRIIVTMESKASFLQHRPLSPHDYILAARFMMQSVAAQILRKGQPWLAEGVNEQWKEACIRVGTITFDRTENLVKSLLKGKSSDTEAEKKKAASLANELSAPFSRALPSTLRQAVALEALICASAEAKVTQEMSAKEVLEKYVRLALAEGRKGLSGESPEPGNLRDSKGFIVTYILLKGVAKLSEMGLDNVPVGGITDDTVAWWGRTIKNLNKRYEKKNGRPLFHERHTLMTKDLRQLVQFYDGCCSPYALRQKEERKTIKPPESRHAFSARRRNLAAAVSF